MSASLALCCWGFVATLLGSGEPVVLTLNAGAPVWDVAIGDVNNDKRTDLLAVLCKDDTDPLEKSLAVFLALDNGQYPAQPSLELDLPPQTGVLFLSEVDGAPPMEVVAADAEGASIYRYEGDALKLVEQPQFASLYPTWSKEPQFLSKKSVDLDGDGIDEWLVPTASGYAVHKVSNQTKVIPCGVNSSVRGDSSMSVTYKFPACHPFQIEGQTQKALAFLTDEKAYFAHGQDWGESTIFKIPLNLGDKWDSSAAMYDIDGNEMPDLVVTQTEGTLNLRILTQVYFASEHFTYPEQPTATFDTKGSFTAPLVQDVNGDGKQDLVFINIPWGVKFFINLFMFRRLGVDLDVYLYENGAFPAQPDYRGHVTIEAPEGREQPSYTMGDFNGDGRMDIAFGSGAENLVVHTGSEKEFISAKPWLTLPVPAFGVADAHDLNGNKAKDIVVYHPGMKSKERIEVVLF